MKTYFVLLELGLLFIALAGAKPASAAAGGMSVAPEEFAASPEATLGKLETREADVAKVLKELALLSSAITRAPACRLMVLALRGASGADF